MLPSSACYILPQKSLPALLLSLPVTLLLDLSSKHKGHAKFKCFLMDHRIIQARGTSGGLQSTLLLQAGSSEIRLGCSGLCPAGHENLHEWKLHILPGQPVLLPGCSHGENVSPFNSSELLSFPLLPSVSLVLLLQTLGRRLGLHCRTIKVRKNH